MKSLFAKTDNFIHFHKSCLFVCFIVLVSCIF